MLQGIIPPIVTPLTRPETLDITSLRRLIEHVVMGGVHGVFVLGSTGESPSLSMDLRRSVIAQTCAGVFGRVWVLVNVSDTAMTHSVALAKCAYDNGASAVAFSPPCYFPLSPQDVLRNARTFCEQSPLPVFLYNVPQYAHNEFAPEAVRELASLPNVAGLKNSNGSLEYFRTVHDAVSHRSDFSVFVGNEEILLPALRAGAHGGVCGGANLFPELYVRLYEAATNGRDSEAEALHELVVRVSEAVYRVGPVESSYLRGLKSALSFLKLINDVLAEPFQPLNESERAELQARFRPVLEAVGAMDCVSERNAS